MCNKIIREKMKDRGVRQWEIADYLGISESTMARKMRYELDPDSRDTISTAIDTIGSKRGASKIDAGSPDLICRDPTPYEPRTREKYIFCPSDPAPRSIVEILIRSILIPWIRSLSV